MTNFHSFIVLKLIAGLLVVISPICGQKCRKPVDLVLVLDASGSMGPDNWIKEVGIARRIIENFKIGPNPSQSRVGIIYFENTATNFLPLRDGGDSLDVMNKLNKLKNEYNRDLKGMTFTDRALHNAVEMFKAVPASRSAAKMLVLITDGKSTKPNLLHKPVKALRSLNVATIALGVGKVEITELELITGSSENVFTTDNFDELKLKLKKLSSIFCPVDGGWSPFQPGPCSKSCGGGVRENTRLCNNPPPRYGGANCVGDSMIEEECKTQPCPVDGGWTPWIPGQCSKTCGTGTEVMTRTCNNPPPSSGGRPCVGSFEKRVICQIKSCTLKYCLGPFDAVIVLDGSGSVKRNNWQKEVDFAQTLVHQFEVSPYKSHIGLIAFSEGAQTYLDLNDNGMSQSSVNTQLNQIRSYWNDPHARTFTDAALKKAADMFIRIPTGRKMKKILIVVTDGRSSKGTDSLRTSIRTLRNLGVTTFSIGVGSKPDTYELQEIAGGGSRVIRLDNFSQLMGTLRNIFTQIC